MSGDVSPLSAAAGLPTYATTSVSLTFKDPSVFWAFLYTSSLPFIPAWTAVANGRMTPDWPDMGWQYLLESFTFTYTNLEFPIERIEDNTMNTSN